MSTKPTIVKTRCAPRWWQTCAWISVWLLVVQLHHAPDVMAWSPSSFLRSSRSVILPVASTTPCLAAMIGNQFRPAGESKALFGQAVDRPSRRRCRRFTSYLAVAGSSSLDADGDGGVDNTDNDSGSSAMENAQSSAHSVLSGSEAAGVAAQQSAIADIRSCSRWLICSAIFDMIINSIISEKVIPTLQLWRQGEWYVTDMEESLLLVLEPVWKIALSVGLLGEYGGAQQSRNGSKDAGNDAGQTIDATKPQESLVSRWTTTAKLWRESSWFFAFTACVEFTEIFHDDVRAWLAMIATCIFGSLWMRRWTQMQLSGRLDDSSFATTGYRVVRNMALCSGALLLQTIVGIALAFSSVFVESKERGLAIGDAFLGAFGNTKAISTLLLRLVSVRTPLIMGWLLWRLRKATATTVIASMESGGADAGRNEGDEKVGDKLWDAQSNFYRKVRDTMRGEVLSKTTALVALRLVSLLKFI